MNNVRLAFERYLDFKTIQRRQSMLRWSIESSNQSSISYKLNIDRTSSEMDNWIYSNTGNTEKSSIFELAYLLNRNTGSYSSIRDNFRVWRRNFTSTQTRFFDNNFDILVKDDCSPDRVLEQGEKQLKLLQKDLSLFHHDEEEFTPDIIEKVNNLFNWLFENKMYSIAYELLKHQDIFTHPSIFFKFKDISNIIITIDKYGTPDDIFSFVDGFKTKPLPNVLKRIRRLQNSQIFAKLSQFKSYMSLQNFDFKQFVDHINEIFQMETKCPDGVKSLTFRIIHDGLKSTNSDSKDIDLICTQFLTNNREYMKFYPPSLILLLLQKSKDTENDINKKYQFTRTFLDLHPDDEEFAYQLFKLLHQFKYSSISFKLWYDTQFKKQFILHKYLNFDTFYKELERIHQLKIDVLPKNFHLELNLAKDDLENMLSILLFSYSKYSTDYIKVQNLYVFKRDKVQLPINECDKLCYLSSLINNKQYDKLIDYYEHTMDFNVNSQQLVDQLIIAFARSQKWKEMEKLYINRFINNDYISIEQYKALFISLSMRAGSIKFILKLWETYLKAGYTPTDHILCCIVISFIKTKAYREALQWFSAYSKYNIALSARSYGLMLNILASNRDSKLFFQLLNTFLSQGNVKLKNKFMHSVINQFATIGDYKSIEKLITEYYPKFGLKVSDEDTRWILKSHYFANRFSIISKEFWSSSDEELDFDLILLTLESTLKMSNPREFRSVWERVYPILFARGELNVNVYKHYMTYWVRVYGYFGTETKINEIKHILKINVLPMSLFNQMIFSAIRTHKPWLTSKIIQLAIANGSSITPKTYSLMIYSNVSMPWIAEKTTKETIDLIDEFLNNKKRDRFGMIDADITPISFKMYIKSILKQGDVYEARRLFELYLETSRNNLIDNIHILNIELMLLGEEERWVEFDACYQKYIEILENYIREAKMLNEEQENMNSKDFSRVEKSQFRSLNLEFDEEKIRQNNTKAKIPNWLKHAHYDIWNYRLQQIEISDSLKEINKIFKSLTDKGILMSNKNLNETALFLSSKPGLFDETIEFINTYILPWHIKSRNYQRMRLRYGWGSKPLEGIGKPLYNFIPEYYFKVMKNLNITLSDDMTAEDKNAFLSNISDSFEFSILKNLAKIESTAEEGQLRGALYSSKKRSYYRRLKRTNKLYNRWNIKYQMAWTNVEELQHFDERELELKEEMSRLGAQLTSLNKECKSRALIDRIKLQRDDVKARYLSLKHEQRVQRRELIQKTRLEAENRGDK